MNIREDIRMSLRSLRYHLVETTLLVVGVSLGIGATSAGITVLAGVNRLDREALALPQYREIVVRPIGSAQTLDYPVVEVSEDESVSLSGADLSAADEAPAVEYAYVMNGAELRIITPTTLAERENRFGPGEPPSDDALSQFPGDRTTPDESAVDIGASLEAPGRNARAGDAPPAEPGNLGPVDRAAMEETLSSIENEFPVLEEIASYSVTEGFFPAYGLVPAIGSTLTAGDVDRGRDYVVLGSALGSTLFADGQAVGRQFMANRNIYTVIGVLEKTGTGLDLRAFTPATITGATGRRFGGRPSDITARFMVGDGDDLDEAKQQLTTVFDREYGVGAVVVETSRDEFEYVQDRNRHLSAIIMILGLTGFLIAAVNVSNILYSRTVKKQRNAGVLKALGAARRNVFEAFSSEGVAVATLGVFAGVALSIALYGLFSDALGLGPLALGTMVLTALGAFALTLVFTVSPAIQVSRIGAADAIRYE